MLFHEYDDGKSIVRRSTTSILSYVSGITAMGWSYGWTYSTSAAFRPSEDYECR